MGFDGLFFGRLDWRDKDTRIKNKELEMIWEAGYYEEDNLFTGVLYNYYFPPPGLCWDLLCNDEPIMDSPFLHDYNLKARAQDFVDFSVKANESYRTNHVAITTGMDFHFQVCFYGYFIAFFNVSRSHTRKICQRNVFQRIFY